MNRHQQMLAFHGLLGATAIGLCLACTYLVVGDEPIHTDQILTPRPAATTAEARRHAAVSELQTIEAADDLSERANRFLQAYAEAVRIETVAHHGGAARPAHRAAPVAGAHEANLPAGARGEPGNRHRLTVPGRLAAKRVIT
ncbi:MAG: hypothetical protein OER86_09330, partial [Phycisphaerae bacterium]|nr:hypothetical protein [Phycisphaerae bacterium]